MNKYLLRTLFIFVLLASCKKNTFAQFEEGKFTHHYFYPEMSGNSIAKDSTRTLDFVPNHEDSEHIKNVISLQINENSPVFFKTPFEVSVSITIASRLKLGDDTVQTHKILTVNYDTAKGSKYNVLDYLILPDAQEVQLTVNLVSVSGATGWDPVSVLKLDDEMRVLSYYTLSKYTAALTPSVNAEDMKGDAVDVSWQWSDTTNNNLTQLEWAWVEDETDDYYMKNGSLDFDDIFDNNSSRVDLDYTVDSFKVPLLYDGVGKLYYRLRASYRKSNGNIISRPMVKSPVF